MPHLVTRYESGDGPQNQMVSFMRSMFGEHVLNFPMLKSTATADAGIAKQTLYEVSRDQFTRSTFGASNDACRRRLDVASPSANLLGGASDWDRASHRHASRRNASHRHDMIEGLNRMTLARRQRPASSDMTSTRVVH